MDGVVRQAIRAAGEVTLITCDPAWTGTHRVIVTGVLVAARPR
jgi:sortase (surface protein transpeptidase)